MFPCLYLLLFNVTGLVGVLGSRCGEGAIEVRLASGGLHSLLESHGEDGPVGTISLEVGYVERELFNGGGGRHVSKGLQQSICS
jgi:hypothetical protein